MSRYRVLLADDEYYIRQRLVKVFPWEEFDMELAGEAEDGSEVLALLPTGIDLAVLDIRMPGMDGLECAKYIRDNYPHTHVVILSGFNDFSYAQEALRCGASDYLLKPLDPEQLCATVAKVVRQMDDERSRSLALDAYHREKRKGLFQSVLGGKETLNALLHTYPELAGATHGVWLALYAHDDQLALLEALPRALQKTGFEAEWVKESDNSVAALVFLPEDGAAKLEAACKTFVKTNGGGVYLAMEGAFPLAEEWKPHYRACTGTLLHRYFVALPAFAPVLPTDNSAYAQDLLKIRQKVLPLANTGDEAGLIAYVNSLYTQVEQSKNPRLLQLVTAELYAVFYLLLQGREQAEGGLPSADATALLEEEYSLGAVQGAVQAVAAQLANRQDTLPSDVAVSRKIAQCIEAEYTDTALSVTGLADRFGMNVSYMGSIFKRVNQTSIHQYITRVRMEAACALLAQKGSKISEVAASVGYSDVFYFSKRFKLVLGVSPKEYAKRIAQGG